MNFLFLHLSSLLQIVYKCTQFIGSGLKIKILLASTRKHIICSRNQEVTSYVREMMKISKHELQLLKRSVLHERK